ncbi:ABC transporter ATP-binding protein [bacterium]|nr:ABC transporter ATP-binding protein [bacterium]
MSFSLVWESAKKWTLLSTFLIVLQGLVPLVSLVVIKVIIDTITESVQSAAPMDSFQRIVILISLLGCTSLLNMFIQSMIHLTQEHQSLLVTDHVLDLLHSKSIEVDLEYYENPDYFDTLHRTQEEAIYRPTRMVHGLVRIIRSGISLAAMAGLVVALHWALIFVLLFAMLPGLFVRLKASQKIYAWQEKRTASQRKAQYYHWVMTSDDYAKEIRIFGLGPLFIRQYRKIRVKLRKEKMNLLQHRISQDFLTKIWSIFIVTALYALLANYTLQAQLTLGTFIMFYQVIQRSQHFFGDILNGLAALYDDALFTSYLFDFLKIGPRIKTQKNSLFFPVPIRSGFKFYNVSFRYPSAEKMALKQINLHIKPGQVVAFVGDNGSGKTTLVKLLCRLYDPVEGSITVDDIKLTHIEISELRRQFGVLFQDFARYHNTARENIWFGNSDGVERESKKIIDAANLTGAHHTIESLPDGYDTLLGKWFESGEELSIGEWQKIAFARCFLKDAPVVVLDEPTSALDAETEYKIFHQVQKMKAEKTIILISHRFSTVRMADIIYVLDSGKIIEQGSHRQLLKLNGKYCRLFKMQAEAYNAT